MEKRENIYRTLLSLFLVVGLVHGAIHLGLYGTGITGLYQSGLSGFAVSGASATLSEKSQPVKPLSGFLLFGEWLMVGGSFVFVTVKKRQAMRHEVAGIKLGPYYAMSKTRTDIDVLYALLMDKHQLSLSSISEVFKVPKTTVVEWARILESGKLIRIDYPHFGEPTLAVNS